MARGIIIGPSESEWPQGSRAPRHPAFAGPPVDEATLLIAATRSLALTKTQAALFLALARRKFRTTEILHGIVDSRRRTHSTSTDRKIVGVMICSIRKRLRGRYTIQTVQGSGYFMPDDDRRQAAGAAAGLSRSCSRRGDGEEAYQQFEAAGGGAGQSQGSLQRQAAGSVYASLPAATIVCTPMTDLPLFMNVGSRGRERPAIQTKTVFSRLTNTAVGPPRKR